MNMKAGGLAVVVVVALVSRTIAVDAQGGLASPAHAPEAISIKGTDIKWERIFPELGERSSELSMLHVDPKTQATQLMIRVPASFHVPKHWHTANETHTVISGTFILEAWTPPEQGVLLFITVDTAWDINWVNGPPRPADLLVGVRQ